jgi:hypothetical protein
LFEIGGPRSQASFRLASRGPPKAVYFIMSNSNLKLMSCPRNKHVISGTGHQTFCEKRSRRFRQSRRAARA